MSLSKGLCASILYGCTVLAGCTIPAEVLFRNFSGETVRLRCRLTERRFFDKLPNKVSLYDTASKRRSYYGDWKSSRLVTWTDTTTFYLDVPPATVVDIKDISNGLVLGARSPDVLILLITKTRVDTVTVGDYPSVATKFRSNGPGVFRPPVYYYDHR